MLTSAQLIKNMEDTRARVQGHPPPHTHVPQVAGKEEADAGLMSCHMKHFQRQIKEGQTNVATT